MKRGTRYDKGSGNTSLYLRIRDDGSYWDFSSIDWVISESINTKAFLTEYSDASDSIESFYSVTFIPPSGGPYTVEIVVASAGEVIGIGDTDEYVSTRSTFDGGAVASVTNPVIVGTNNDKTGYSLIVTPITVQDMIDGGIALESSVQNISGDLITVQDMIDGGIALESSVQSISISGNGLTVQDMIDGGIAKESTILSVSGNISIIMSDINDLYDERFGKWVLDIVNKTMTLYRLDNTILAVFDLTTTNSTIKPYISRTPQ